MLSPVSVLFINANTFEANQATIECSRGAILTVALIVSLVSNETINF